MRQCESVEGDISAGLGCAMLLYVGKSSGAAERLRQGETPPPISFLNNISHPFLDINQNSILLEGTLK